MNFRKKELPRFYVGRNEEVLFLHTQSKLLCKPDMFGIGNKGR